MRAFRAAIIKTLFAIALLAVAFWPQYGAAYYMVANFQQAPEAFLVATALWVAALALNLPLSLRYFQFVSTASLVTMFAVGIYALWNAGHFAADSANSWTITAIVMVGVLLGWWTSSARLWRWWRAIMPTDEVPGGE